MRKIKCYRYCYEEDNKVIDNYIFAFSMQSAKKQLETKKLILIKEVENVSCSQIEVMRCIALIEFSNDKKINAFFDFIHNIID